MLPKPIERQLVLEDRDGSATYESVKRRATNWIVMNSTARADMDSGTMGIVGDCEDDDGGQDGDSSGDLMGLKGGKGKQGIGQHNGYCYLCGQWRDSRQRIASQQQQCAATVGSGDVAKSCLVKEK